MFWYKRTLGVLFVCLLAVPVCAFTFSYGNLVEVLGVERQDGTVQLPLTNKKYTNVKVLSKTVYDFLQTCTNDCIYSAPAKDFTIAEYRVAANRQDMLIATVQFNEDLLLTVLAFKNKENIRVKFPAVVKFTDRNLENQIQKAVSQVAKENL